MKVHFTKSAQISMNSRPLNIKCIHHILKYKKLVKNEKMKYYYVTLCLFQCCGSGSGIGCFLTPGSGIRNKFFPDPGSQDHIFCFDNFFGKKFYNSLKIGPNFFLQHFKAKITYNFVNFVGT
jgi:hypothetical protein